MIITKELNLANFNFWAGAKNHSFTYSELNELEYILKDLFPEGADETQINDLFWFDEEYLCELIGLKYKKYLKRN